MKLKLGGDIPGPSNRMTNTIFLSSTLFIIFTLKNSVSKFLNAYRNVLYFLDLEHRFQL